MKFRTQLFKKEGNLYGFKSNSNKEKTVDEKNKNLIAYCGL
jgi:hypothetical protein